MAITITNNLPTPVIVGTPYSGNVVASGGVAPYAYTITSGSLPDGLTLDGATGAVIGTPTAIGDASFEITATDSTLATGVLDTDINVTAGLVSPQLPVIARTPMRTVNEGCQPGGRQMARLFYDAVASPNFSTILRGNQQQSIGLVKTLLFNVNMVGVNITAGDLQNATLVIESSLNLMRVSIGPPPEVLDSGGNALSDFTISGCVPFFADEDSSVKITLGNGSPITMSQCNVRIFFANFELPAYCFTTADNLSD